MPERLDLVRTNEYPLSGTPLPPGYYPDATQEADIRAYLAAFMRRWKVMLVVFGLVFGLLVGVTFNKKKVYEATTKLIVSSNSKSAADDSAIAGLAGGSRTVATQIEVLTSSDLIDSAFKRLPKEDRIQAFGGDSAPSWSVSVTNKDETDVIYVTASAWKPETAAGFANSIAQTYLDRDLNENSRSARQAREYVEKEMDVAQDELAQASLELATYQKQTGLVSASSQAERLASASIALEDSVAEARSDLAAATRQLDLIQRQLKQTDPTIRFQATVTENPQVVAIQGKIMELENRLYELSQEYTPTSRQVRQVQGQIDAQKKRLETLSKTLVTEETEQHNPLVDSLLEKYSTAKSEQIASEQKLAAMQEQLAKRKDVLKDIPMRERRLAQLQQRVEVLNRTFNMLSDKYYNLLIEERSRLAGGVISSRAQPPGAPSSPKVPMELVRAFIVALGLAAAAALVLERLDTKVHQPEEIERATGAATLAMLPEATGSTEDGRLRLGMTDPNHAFLEAFRLLRNNLMFSMTDDQLGSFADTSSVAGEGKSTTSVNLAKAFAMDGKRVLLMDLDLRRPTIHSWHGLPNDVGFTSVVRSTVAFQEAVVSVDGYDVLTTGPLPPDPTEFMNSERSHRTVATAKEHYDIVIVDAPPTYGLSDIQVIGLMVDGAVLVAALDRVQKPLLMAAQRMLRQAGVRLLGTVVNHAKGGQGYYGYYYGGYGHYGSDAYDHDVSHGKGKRRRKPKSLPPA